MTISIAASDTARAVRGAAGMLLLMVAFTGCWLALSAYFVEFQLLSRTLTRPLIHALILYGLWVGLSRAGFDPRRRITLWLAVALPFTVWLAVVWTSALTGAFEPRPDGLPLLPIAIFLPLLIVLPILLPSSRIGEILDAIPPAWLVGLQLYRVMGGIFLVLWGQGRLTGVFALPAGIGDVATGLLALPVAYYLAAGGRGGRAAAIAWNLFGVADLINAVAIGTMSAPGPLQLIFPDGPVIGAGTYPLVMIPAFAVPSSIILHALSLRQLTRIGRRVAPDHAAGSPAAATAA